MADGQHVLAPAWLNGKQLLSWSPGVAAAAPQEETTAVSKM